MLHFSKNHLILFLPRTGSSYLLSCLGSHPEVNVLCEGWNRFRLRSLDFSNAETAEHVFVKAHVDYIANRDEVYASELREWLVMGSS